MNINNNQWAPYSVCYTGTATTNLNAKHNKSNAGMLFVTVKWILNDNINAEYIYPPKWWGVFQHLAAKWKIFPPFGDWRVVISTPASYTYCKHYPFCKSGPRGWMVLFFYSFLSSFVYMHVCISVWIIIKLSKLVLSCAIWHILSCPNKKKKHYDAAGERSQCRATKTELAFFL